MRKVRKSQKKRSSTRTAAPKVWSFGEEKIRKYAPLISPFFWFLSTISIFYSGLLLTSPSLILLSAGADYFAIQGLYFSTYAAIIFLSFRLFYWWMREFISKYDEIPVAIPWIAFALIFFFISLSYWGTAVILIFPTVLFILATAIGTVSILEGKDFENIDDNRLIDFFSGRNFFTLSKWRIPALAAVVLTSSFSIGFFRNFTEWVGTPARVYFQDGSLRDVRILALSPSGAVLEIHTDSWLDLERSFVLVPNQQIQAIETPKYFLGGYIFKDDQEEPKGVETPHN